jgi:hypothetical protein
LERLPTAAAGAEQVRRTFGAMIDFDEITRTYPSGQMFEV